MQIQNQIKNRSGQMNENELEEYGEMEEGEEYMDNGDVEENENEENLVQYVNVPENGEYIEYEELEENEGNENMQVGIMNQGNIEGNEDQQNNEGNK